MRKLLLLIISVFWISVVHAGAGDAGGVAKFHNAVEAGDVHAVRSMLASSPSLATSVDRHKFQPLHLLDMECNEDILDLLLAKGADINARNDEGVTLLHIITDLDAIDLLIRRGADMEARDNRGWTPLIEQADNQQNGPNVVAALLAHGANPNARGYSGETALQQHPGNGLQTGAPRAGKANHRKIESTADRDRD